MDFILGALFFLLASSCASRKMPRLHRLAHKASVMQASVQCACTARQKQDSALYATRRHKSMTSLRLPSTDVIDCGVELYQGFRATRLPAGCKGQKVLSSSLKNVYCWLFILGEKRFSVGKSRSILLIQILYNAVKRLIFFKCGEFSKSTAFIFNALLIFLEYLFEFLINTASPASDSLSTEFYGKKSFKYYNFPSPPRPPFCGYFVLSFFF